MMGVPLPFSGRKVSGDLIIGKESRNHHVHGVAKLCRLHRTFFGLFENSFQNDVFPFRYGATFV